MTARIQLGGPWEICSTPPDAVGDPAGLDTLNIDWHRGDTTGTVAAILRAAGLWSLDGPPRRFDSEDWWFRTSFAHDSSNQPTPSLRFEGLATHVQVWLNGKSILQSDNMFVAHVIDITGLVRPINQLNLCFRSLDRALTIKRARPKWKAPMLENQQLRWHRTTVLGRTPGWSPPCAAVGPWRPIWLESRSPTADLRAFTTRAFVDTGTGIVEITGPADALLEAGINGIEVSLGGQIHQTSVRAGSTCHRLELPSPQLWWPHTHGDPDLYDVSFVGANKRELLCRVGFRRVEIIQGGDEFKIEVNGARIFCRGACWTPADPVTLQGDPARNENLLTTARDAGLNMLRISGATVYESDDFYAVCDRLGILVWQDFMFANMDYPAGDASFVASIETEVRHQLSRWLPHPCVAVLCGNSEVEQQAAMSGASRELWKPRLFHELIPKLVEESEIGARYWPSSASGGAFPHQPNKGTTSYYGVGAYLLPLEDARRSSVRFATEALAFANVPEASSLGKMPGGLSLNVHNPQWKARVPRDQTAGWDFDDVRDAYLERLFAVNPRELRYSDHARYVELSRIASGEVISAAFAEWRRQGSECNGALVWFLKDLWHGAGWGLLDADGRPKAALECVRDALQSQTILLTDEGCNGLVAQLVNDRSTQLDCTMRLTLIRPGGRAEQLRRPVSLPGRSCVALPLTELFDYVPDLNHVFRFGPAAYNVIAADLLDAAGRSTARACHFPAGRNIPLSDTLGLACSGSISGADVLLNLSAREFAQHVAIEIDNCIPERQYFHLLPGESRQIAARVLKPKAGTVLRGWVKALNGRTASAISSG